MVEYVEIALRRNRGWPWPEDSYGAEPMFGEGGWCLACGVPNREQTGPIVLQTKGFARLEGGWVPNWQFDVYCLESGLAQVVVETFGVGLRRVDWRGTPPGSAFQIVVPQSSYPWFDADELDRIISPIHGVGCVTCSACGVERWMPVGMDVLPRPPDVVFSGHPPVVASRERFGDGKRSFRQILWRRDLADFLVSSSSRDFNVQP